MLLCACQADVHTPAPAAAEDNPQNTESTQTLTICLGYEPDSLYPYAVTSQAARDVLQAIYDGPLDFVDGQAVPVILESIPAYVDGSAEMTSVSVQAGDSVVNLYGEVISLQAGAQVYPSGCTDISCAITWDGASPLQMDQPSATFRLLPGLTWSDGHALTAADSVYSFTLAMDPITPGDKTYVEQTAEYQAMDETSLKWTGKAGLVTDAFEHYLWMPLPQHVWGGYSAADLLEADISTRSPLGWGAYVMDEWAPGEYIRLKKNPSYFRADEGLPQYDHVVFKITNPYGDTNIANLKFEREPFAQFNYDIGDHEDEIMQNGCDLTSSTADMSDQLEVLNILMNYFSDPAVKVIPGKGKQATWLLFNQRESENGQTSIFSDPDMRQAVGYCLERGELAQNVFYNLVDVPDAFAFSYSNKTIPELVEVSSSTDEEEFSLISNPAKGRELLKQSGWVDKNLKDDLPRTAQGVSGIPDGQELSINYLVRDDKISLAAANQVKTSLTECGFQVNLIAAAPEVFWDSDSPESILRGNYHLVQLDWELPVENPCPLFASQNIPQESSDYKGLNFIGFSNSEVDEICEYMGVMSLSADEQARLEGMETIINQELAVIPLYISTDLMVARSDFCAVSTASGQSELAKIEEFTYGESCKP